VKLNSQGIVPVYLLFYLVMPAASVASATALAANFKWGYTQNYM
jgi:hypothetical protein